MRQKLKPIVKAGVAMFLIGVALAAAAPMVASLLGPAVLGAAGYAQAMATPILYTGLFFGGFGALNAVISPLVEKFFSPASSCAPPPAAMPMSSPLLEQVIEKDAPAAQYWVNKLAAGKAAAVQAHGGQGV